MKRLGLILVFFSFSLMGFSQSAESNIIDIIVKPNKPISEVTSPPLLSLVPNTLSFIEENGNKLIDSREQCQICFMVKNNGKGVARNCEARITLAGTTSGLSTRNIQLPAIAVGETYRVSIPITADIYTRDGQVTATMEIYEPNGLGISPFKLTVATKAFEEPLLRVVDYSLSSASGRVTKMEQFTLAFNLQNINYGNAEQVKVKIILPNDIYVMDGSSEINFPLIKSGEAKSINITLVASNRYNLSNIPITIDVKEKYGKYAENKQIDIAINAATIGNTHIATNDDSAKDREQIELAMITSDVDRNIPQTNILNQNTFVIIIANETYQQVAPVPFALNDGAVFRKYCEQTLGIPTKNIREQTNATGNQIKVLINWLHNVVQAFNAPKIIFYYAGHGIPDETSKSAYLLPVDGSGSDVSTGYKLDDLYATLGNMSASRVTIFMDACFSGSKREEGMLASARGVALKSKSGVPQGNMVVFSAAQGDETAYPNKEKQHGLFTYYLLKKLQETEGNVSLQELGNYIITNVKQQSILLNSKMQTPCVTPSASLNSDWQDWKLK